MSIIDLQLRLKGLKEIVGELGEEIEKDLNNMASTLANEVYAEGVRLVQQRLKSTVSTYMQNFVKEEPHPGLYVIRLLPGAMHLEEGYGSFDIKKGLLKGPKARVSKKGVRYNIVPFRIKTEAGASNLFEQLLGQELHQALKTGSVNRFGQKADLTKTQTIQKTTSLKRTESGGWKKEKGDKRTLEGIVGRVKTKDAHPYLHGAVKVQKSYGKTTQSQYLSFRVVSENSDANKWIHPGFAGVHVFPDLEKWAEAEVTRVLSNYALSIS